MKITENNFTVTTIYFDGQFWCALIERCQNGKSKTASRKSLKKRKNIF
ncbi:MAG: hypothetical protein IJP62_12200 [Treponema sp.]|nr:hypothetical protein [Treponema sp.]